MADLASDFVYTPAALLQGDILHFWNHQFGIIAAQFEMLNNSCSNLTVVLVLPEASAGRAFARGYGESSFYALLPHFPDVRKMVVLS